MNRAITARTFPRIHLTLIDLAGVTQRRFGGAGLSVDTMPAVVTAERAQRNSMRVVPNVSSRDRGDLESYLNRLSVEMGVCFCVEVEAMMPQHVGLGSKTASMLGMALACNAVADGHFRPAALARMSGRGGTSGVGVNATFTGGFVVDGGHKERTRDGEFCAVVGGRIQCTPAIACETELSGEMARASIHAEGRALFGRGGGVVLLCEHSY